MRLSAEQQQAIREVVLAVAGDGARILVFGSRLDDTRRGGDIDLLVETQKPLGVLDKAKLKLRLQGRLGLPVDVLVCMRGQSLTPFQRIARDSGVAIHGSSS